MNNNGMILFRVAALDFSNHLKQAGNHRIFFSGRFGMGKTTFLKQFFADREVAKKYNVIHLFPVNYTVGSNEDIFRYLKRDILVALLSNSQIKVENLELSTLEAIPYYILQNLPGVLSTSLSMFIATAGSSLDPINASAAVASLTKIEKLIEDFANFKKSTNNDINDAKKIDSFYKELKEKEGSIYEFNFISEIITQFLTTLKEVSQKENILIIDDLDRIDPHHIFRMLNIFGAHYDNHSIGEKDNKFGFDKIILVGDANNVSDIFHHVYGLNVDFAGYMDKFYSHNIYTFNNTNEIKQEVHNRLEKLNYRLHNSFRRGGEEETNEMRQFIGNNYIRDFSQLITCFLLVGKLNLRTFNPKSIIITTRYILEEGNNFNSINSFILKIECLEKIVGSIPNLLNYLEKADVILGDNYLFPNYMDLLSETLPIFNMNQHRFQALETSYNIEVSRGGSNGNQAKVLISYKIGRENGDVFASDIQNATLRIPLNQSAGPNIFAVYIAGIKELQKINYF